MRYSVTILSLAATLFTLGCAGSRGDAPKCEVVAASAEAHAADLRVAQWKRRLPAIFKYNFERSADRAIRAIPECVKTAGQTPEFANYVDQTGLILTDASLALKFEYLYTLEDPRVMDVKLKRSGLDWRGSQFEDSLRGRLGLRGSDLDLPTCTAKDLARPEEIKFIAKGGRGTRVATLTDAPGALRCH